MAVLKGSLTWHGFRITDTAAAQALGRAEILRCLEKSAFRDPDVADGETESAGFVVFDEILDTDFEAASEKTFVGSYVLWAFRRDVLRVPAAYLKALCKAEEQRSLRASGRPRIGRAERASIKERVHQMLLQRALPSIQTADVVWSLTDNRVRVFAGSASLVELVAEHFEAAFDFDLLSNEPFVRLLDRGFKDEDLVTLDMPVPVHVPALLSR
jgi:hypothetical protein